MLKTQDFRFHSKPSLPKEFSPSKQRKSGGARKKERILSLKWKEQLYEQIRELPELTLAEATGATVHTKSGR